MIRPGCYQPERQLLDGFRTRWKKAPFHGALRNAGYVGRRGMKIEPEGWRYPLCGRYGPNRPTGTRRGGIGRSHRRHRPGEIYRIQANPASRLLSAPHFVTIVAHPPPHAKRSPRSPRRPVKASGQPRGSPLPPWGRHSSLVAAIPFPPEISVAQAAPLSL